MTDELRPGFSAALRQEVDSILSNPSFSRAISQAQFLRQLCDQTLLGDRGSLSQYALAVDGMGKPDSFDPIFQSNVRVRASRLRASLERHYRLMQPCAGLCIFLRTGSYKLHLAPPEKAYPQIHIATHPAASSPIHELSRHRQLARPVWLGFGGLAILALAATARTIVNLM